MRIERGMLEKTILKLKTMSQMKEIAAQVCMAWLYWI